MKSDISDKIFKENNKIIIIQNNVLYMKLL